jgi:hypothetical protein
MIPLVAMLRIWQLTLLAAMAAYGQPDVPDRAFNDIRFEDWLHGIADARMSWSLRVDAAVLNGRQRLEVDLYATVGGKEFETRGRPGRMLLFLQIRDRNGATYQSNRVLTLIKETRSGLPQLTLAEKLCVVPGDYQIDAVLYDSVSKEHSLKTTKLRVPELRHDPLPDIWMGAPSVMVLGPVSYSQPLHLPVETKTPVRIDVVVTRPANRSNIAALLKVISEMNLKSGLMRVSSLDLQSRRTITRKVEGDFDPNRLWLMPLNNNLYTVDVQALENEAGGAQFFVSEIRKILERPIPEPEHVLIVLSDPKKFLKGEDLRPIQTKRQPGTLVFYIRCDHPQRWAAPPPMSPPPGPQDWSTPPELPSGKPPVIRHEPGNFDSLERTLEPLHPKAFHVTTAIQFRKVLGEIMSEISHNN